MKADLVIRGGRVLDGTGAPERTRRRGDSRREDRGSRERAVEADEVIDAAGKMVAPGFIDLHSHGDLVLAWPSEKRLPLLEGRIAQGITTEIVGNCGLGGGASLRRRGTALLPQLNGWMSPAPFPWTWKGVGDYLSHLERLGLPVNVGTLVPHGPASDRSAFPRSR